MVPVEEGIDRKEELQKLECWAFLFKLYLYVDTLAIIISNPLGPVIRVGSLVFTVPLSCPTIVFQIVTHLLIDIESDDRTSDVSMDPKSYECR